MGAPNHPCSGERVHTAILTADQVREIRARYSSETISQRELAKQYEVAQTTISAAVRGVNWKSVQEEHESQK